MILGVADYNFWRVADIRPVSTHEQLSTYPNRKFHLMKIQEKSRIGVNEYKSPYLTRKEEEARKQKEIEAEMSYD